MSCTLCDLPTPDPPVTDVDQVEQSGNVVAVHVGCGEDLGDERTGGSLRGHVSIELSSAPRPHDCFGGLLASLSAPQFINRENGGGTLYTAIP